jgi:hypothetical protein
LGWSGRGAGGGFRVGEWFGRKSLMVCQAAPWWLSTHGECAIRAEASRWTTRAVAVHAFLAGWELPPTQGIQPDDTTQRKLEHRQAARRSTIGSNLGSSNYPAEPKRSHVDPLVIWQVASGKKGRAHCDGCRPLPSRFRTSRKQLLRDAPPLTRPSQPAVAPIDIVTRPAALGTDGALATISSSAADLLHPADSQRRVGRISTTRCFP